MPLLFRLAGAGIGLAETAESTLVAHLLPDRLRGSDFGLLGGLRSAGDFLSSAVVDLRPVTTTGQAPAAGGEVAELAERATAVDAGPDQHDNLGNLSMVLPDRRPRILQRRDQPLHGSTRRGAEKR